MSKIKVLSLSKLFNYDRQPFVFKILKIESNAMIDEQLVAIIEFIRVVRGNHISFKW